MGSQRPKNWNQLPWTRALINTTAARPRKRRRRAHKQNRGPAPVSPQILEKQRLLAKWTAYDHGSSGDVGGWLADREHNPHGAVWCWKSDSQAITTWDFENHCEVDKVMPDRYHFYTSDTQQSLEA